MKNKLFIFLLLPLILSAYTPSYLSLDKPMKSPFISSELNIKGNLTSDMMNDPADSFLAGNMNTGIALRTLFPGGIDIIAGYDSYYRDVSVTGAWSWIPMFSFISTRITLTGYSTEQSGSRESGVNSTAMVNLNAGNALNCFIAAHYDMHNDFLAGTGIMIGLPLEFLYFERAGIIGEYYFLTLPAGAGDPVYKAALFFKTWGHQFFITLSNSPASNIRTFAEGGDNNALHAGFAVRRYFEF
ncbi:MAG: hypothetical protein SVK54_01810 [candidate division WOR-3 bacterium]|nr:hypothetical protein [candidate division WOR-3 bacterium]